MVDAVFTCQCCKQEVVANDYDRHEEGFTLDALFLRQPIKCLLCGGDTLIENLTLRVGAPEKKVSIVETLPSHSSRVNDTVRQAIEGELDYLEKRRGKAPPTSLAGFLVMLEAQIVEARRGWLNGLQGNASPLKQVLILAVTAIDCMNRYGVEGTTIAKNDDPLR